MDVVDAEVLDDAIRIGELLRCDHLDRPRRLPPLGTGEVGGADEHHEEVHRHDLEGWLAPFLPIRDGIAIMLRLLRESRQRAKADAINGMYQLMLNGRNPPLLGIWVPAEFDCVPEISAGKHAINIRFVVVDKQRRPRLCEKDIGFVLTI